MGLTPLGLVLRNAGASYPHVRGAYSHRAPKTTSRWGRSPHAWGLHDAARASRRDRRAIPTYVGLTVPVSATYHMTRSHPHVCGAYAFFSGRNVGADELSPRAWGLHYPLRPGRPGCGAIPTHVGLTRPHRPDRLGFTSYPHVCGAYHEMIRVWIKNHELSPRAWGLPVQKEAETTTPRAIPTCVGLTQEPAPIERVSTSYPHVRGAYTITRVREHVPVEPSPRVWGLRKRAAAVVRERGAIPTYVGLTFRGAPRRRVRRSHPHVRGAYSAWPSRLCSGQELSPRAWGLLLARIFSGWRRRAIPTCVGLTRQTDACGHPHPSHPHVRGAYCADCRAKRVGEEPSPRAWGLPDGLRLPSSPSGAIPTCVGLTLCGADHATQRKSYPHVREAYVKKSRWIDAGIELSPRAWGLPGNGHADLSRRRAIPTCVGLTLVHLRLCWRVVCFCSDFHC